MENPTLPTNWLAALSNANYDGTTQQIDDAVGKYLWEVLKYMGIPVEEIDYNFPKGNYYPTENPFC